MTVGTLGELEIIRRLRAPFSVPAGEHRVVRDIGDDGAVVAFTAGRPLVLTTDLLIESVHFRREWMPADCLGHKSLAVSLSDLAAMGARPEVFLLDVGLPADWPASDLEAFAAGMAALAARFAVRLAGGDTVASPRLHIGVTAVGSVSGGGEMPRSGGRPGDRLVVIGELGAAATGLRLLEDGWRRASGKARPPAGGPGAVPPDAVPVVLDAHLLPRPRVAEGRALARAASAAIDVSDGLARDLPRLAEASSCGALVEAGALPILPETRRICEAWGRDPVGEALAGGEDYALLAAVPPAALPLGLGETVIGRLTPAGEGIRLWRDGREAAFPEPGHRHFRIP